MKKIVSIFSFVMLFAVMQSTAFAYTNWYWLSSNDKYSTYLDRGNINSWVDDQDGLHKKIWVKHTYNEDGVQDVINHRNNIGLSTEGYENLSYNLNLIEFKYTYNQNKYMRITSIVDYDTSENVLSSLSDAYATWEDIIPGSAGDYLFKFVYHL